MHADARLRRHLRSQVRGAVCIRVAQVPAQHRLLIQQYHLRTVRGCSQRGAHARRPAANHGHIHMHILFVVFAGPRAQQHLAQPGSGAQNFFVQRPQHLWPDESFVIEANRQKLVHDLCGGHQVSVQ